MIETARNLEKLRGLLLNEPFRYHEAFAVVKEMLVHGVNDRKVMFFQQVAVMLLERAFRPGLHGHVERESMLMRLCARILRNPGLDPRDVAEEVAEMVAGIAPPSPVVAVPAASKEQADRMAALLSRIPGFSSVDIPSGMTGWNRVAMLVETFTLDHARKQRHDEREWQRKRGQLARLTETLMQAADHIHHPTEGLKRVLSLLDVKGAQTDKLSAFVEGLLVEVRLLGRALVEARINVQTAGTAIARLNALFRKADTQLLRSRDQAMVDIFTGLGNRFALSEHLKRLTAGNRQDVLFLLFDEDPRVYPKIARAEVYRVLGFIGRHLHKLGFGLPFYVGDEFLVVIPPRESTQNSFAEPIKGRILDKLMAMSGFPTHVNFGLATVFVTGVVDETILMDTGKRLARKSAKKRGLLLVDDEMSGG